MPKQLEGVTDAALETHRQGAWVNAQTAKTIAASRNKSVIAVG
jgi:hypothetical protein